MAKFCGSTAKFLTNPCKHLQNFYKKNLSLNKFMDTANIQLILSAVEMKNNQIYIVYNKLFHSFKR